MNKIKYDKRDRRLYLILAVLSTAVWVVSFILLDTDLIDGISAEILGAFIVISSLIFPIIAFAAWCMFLDSYAYLKRLQKYGFIVPEKKRDYDNDIEKLVTTGIKSFKEPSRESGVLAIVAWVVSVGMIGFTIFYFIRFSHMLENVSFLGIVAIFISILWAIFGVYFWRQRSRKRYRDDVEYNSSMKKRIHLLEGLVTIIVLLAITAVVATNMYTMAKYIEKSREMNETELVLS